MNVPTDRRYLDTHEWHKLEADGTIVTIGISEFAVKELTDITYVDVRQKSGGVKAGQSFGEIESVKATSELYCGIDGEVVQVNQAVVDDPSLINQDPYEKGWLVKVRMGDKKQLDGLLTAQAYTQLHAH